MRIKQIAVTMPLILLFSLAIISCAHQLSGPLDIKSNGFITDNCYQAVLEIDADDTAKGLVSRRESAYLRAKKSELTDMAAENIAAYCIDNQIKAGIIDKNRKNFDYTAHKNDLLLQVRGLAGGGDVAYVYYTEKNSMMIGYRIYKLSFKKKIDDIIQKPAAARQENNKQNPRS